MVKFIPFIEEEYEHLIADNKRMLNQFKKNSERDTAILHFFIGSGLRVRELASVEIENLDFQKNRGFVDRKGRSEKSVPVSIDEMHTIKRYLAIHNTCYPDAKYVPFLFVTHKGKVREFPRRVIQDLVEKYTGALLKNSGIPPINYVIVLL